VLISV